MPLGGGEEMRKFIKSSWLAAQTFAISATPAFAQARDVQIEPSGTEFDALKNITIPGIISGLIKLALIVAAIIFFFMLVIGGIRWILSGGDKTAMEAARGQITAALVGLVIVFSAFAIVQLIKILFGVDILGGLQLPSF